MKDLSNVTKQEQEDFFASFDVILCDVDGVLRIFHDQIRGAKEAILSLQKRNKKIIFVSNNATISPQTYYNQLKSAGYNLDETDLVTPAKAIISYLKEANFSKEIYLIGMTALRGELEKAGFKFADFGPDDFGDSISKYLKLCVEENDKVGAVIVDIDVNLTVLKLRRAATCLRKPEVIFITGGGDKKLVVGEGQTLIGPGHFQGILEDITGRKSVRLAKPGKDLNDYIVAKLKVGDPERVLFIGDSISEDMGFAAKCGYKKLLVLSGLTKKNSILNWEFPEEYKPDYYVDSLKTIEDIITKNSYNK